MTDRELMQQALDALDEDNYMSSTQWKALCRKTCTALRARLSQPEPVHANNTLQERVQKTEKNEHEPVAWTVGGLITDFSRDFSAYQTRTYTVPLYTAPPQRKEERKPVAWMHEWNGDVQINKLPAECYGKHWTRTPLYTTPPQREWQGLTDEDLDFWGGELGLGELGKGVLRAVNAHLKEKNT